MWSSKEEAGIKAPKERSLCSLPPTYAPSLVYSHGKKYQDQIFFTLSDGCHHARSIPEMRGMRCVASCYGWLLLQSYYSTDCYLFNPVSLTKIHLPPLIHSSFKIGVLTSPPTDCNCVIMFFSEKRKSCIFCRIGDTSWIEQELGFDKKTRKLIQGPFQAAFSCLGKIYLFFQGMAVIDVYECFVSVKLYESKYVYVPHCGTHWSSYFVESCGDIFQVNGIHLGVTANIIWLFKVFKLDFSTMGWVKIGSLGDRIFVLGEVSTSFSANDLDAKGNCIYFYRPQYTHLYKYDMDDGSVTISLLCPKRLPHWRGPFWVVPNCKPQVNKYVAKVVKSPGEVKGEWSWEDLPTDLVQLISSSLSLCDCIRFRLICKTWIAITSPLRSNPPLMQSNSASQSLPWLITFPVSNEGACSFYHPIHNGTYTMDIPEIAGASICDSKYGWLLLSMGKTYLFLNLLTMETIKLPDCEHWQDFVGVSFSSPPTSSDCVVFGITEYHRNFVEMLIYCKDGEDFWYEYRIDTKVPYEFMASDCNPVFCDGVFYCLSKDGKLGCFNPMETEDDDFIWKVLPVPPVFSFTKLMDFTTDIRGFIGEYDGEIISVFVGGVLGKPIKVYKLDRPEMKWVRLDNLGDKMLFLGQKTCMSVTARLKGIENRIYLPRFKGNANIFYSLRSGQYHSFGEEDSRADWVDTSEYWNCEWILPMLPV